MSLRVCIQTQTPFVRLVRPMPEGTLLSALREGEDYLPSPGGVTRMLHGLLEHLTATGRVRDAAWLSLSRDSARLRLDGRARLELVSMEPDLMQAYATAKGALWAGLHDLPLAFGLDVDALRSGLECLARSLAARVRSQHDEREFDVVYAHDFQLLEAADALDEHMARRGPDERRSSRAAPSRVPRVFHWHVPVGETVARDVQEYVVRSMDKFDTVIVSTKAYARRLRAWGVRAPIHASYPFLGAPRRRVVTSADLRAFDGRWGLKADDVVFTVVARLDPMKSQDVAIRALARVARHEPRAKLLLVGGGGFSAGRHGLGMTHADAWREELVRLARDLGVADRVVLTGGIPDDDLDAAYARSRAVLLPSSLEGFGLAPVEGWARGRPVIVSTGAGVAELVRPGENGGTFAPGDDAALARHMLALARDADLADRMGRAGRVTARACSLERGADDVCSVLERAVAARRAT